MFRNANVGSILRKLYMAQDVTSLQGLSVRHYAVKKAGKSGGKVGPMETKTLPVETDATRLVTYVCGSNIYKEGEDVKIGSDDEYPSWLWSLRLNTPTDLEEMDPNTLRYWRRYRKLARRREFALLKGKKF